MRTNEVASTYADWGEAAPGQEGGADAAPVEPPVGFDDWLSYMAPHIEALWRAMQDNLAEQGLPLLDVFTLAEFQEFCFQGSSCQPRQYYSKLLCSLDNDGR